MGRAPGPIGGSASEHRIFFNRSLSDSVGLTIGFCGGLVGIGFMSPRVKLPHRQYTLGRLVDSGSVAQNDEPYMLLRPELDSTTLSERLISS